MCLVPTEGRRRTRGRWRATRMDRTQRFYTRIENCNIISKFTSNRKSPVMAPERSERGLHKNRHSLTRKPDMSKLLASLVAAAFAAVSMSSLAASHTAPAAPAGGAAPAAAAAPAASGDAMKADSKKAKKSKKKAKAKKAGAEEA